MLRSIITAFSLLILAAHGLRSGSVGVTGFWLATVALLFSPWSYKHMVLAGLLAYGSWLWTDLALHLVELRRANGMDWLRLATILGTVVTLTAASGLWQLHHGWQQRTKATVLQGTTCLLIVAGLALARQKSGLDILLPDRFLPGSGWLLIIALGVYGAQLVGRMHGDTNTTTWRKRLWTLFSVVFFGQLLLGLAGLERLLMTGTLHLPVPALIGAGPLYRGEGLFMPILFTVTVILVGPAWCSHLCYIGAWDNLAAAARPRATPLPPWNGRLRWIICLATMGSAYLLGRSDLPVTFAVLLGAAFGLCGVAVMLTWSRRSGTMMHCTVYCPMGLIANLLGRINPFRIHIGEGCTRCGRCARVCRYGALTPRDLDRRQAGLTCSLCGDCLASCRENHLAYRLPGLRGDTARAVFLVLIVSLHAIFLGVARI